jgi:hypothetical protein
VPGCCCWRRLAHQKRSHLCHLQTPACQDASLLLLLPLLLVSFSADHAALTSLLPQLLMLLGVCQVLVLTSAALPCCLQPPLAYTPLWVCSLHSVLALLLLQAALQRHCCCCC